MNYIKSNQFQILDCFQQNHGSNPKSTRLISINNTNVIKEKLLPNDVIAIIKTTPTTITITVETSPSTYILWTSSEKDVHPPSIPAWFLDKGIPNNVGDRIYKIYHEELIPELIKSNKMEHIFENEMSMYRSKQVWKIRW